MSYGHEVTDADGTTRFVLGRHLAYMGKEGCQDVRCTRISTKPGEPHGRCVGYHCPICGAPCSSQGHRECGEATS